MRCDTTRRQCDVSQTFHSIQLCKKQSEQESPKRAGGEGRWYVYVVCVYFTRLSIASQNTIDDTTILYMFTYKLYYIRASAAAAAVLDARLLATAALR